MEKLFYPKSVAVIGVSDNPGNIARNIILNFKKWKYNGKLYGVNPRGGKVMGVGIYPTLMDIPGEVDLAVVLSPAATVPGILDQAHLKGVEYLCIETAGFSEYSGAGAVLAETVKSKATQYGIKFVGPNGLGIISAECGVATPFVFIKPSSPGCVSLLAQSGGVGMSIVSSLREHNLSINKFVSLGNKYSLDEVDFLRYFIDDEGTKIILCYLESIVRGREFIEIAASSEKPILVCKSGTTESGAKRAVSHTAALMNDDRLLDAAMKQAGIIRVERLDHLFHFSRTFLQPPMRGNRLVIASPAGGFTVLAADSADKAGFSFPDISEETRSAIVANERAGVINLGNPIDLGDAFGTDTLILTIDKTLAQENVDGMILTSSRRAAKEYKGPFTSMMRNPVPEIEPLVAKHNKPVIVAFIGAPEIVREYRGDSHIPVYDKTDLAIEALAAYRDFCTRCKPHPPSKRTPVLPQQARNLLDSLEPGLVAGAAAFNILTHAGLSVCKFASVFSAKEAASTAKQTGFPVAMKIDSPAVAHKTEMHAIRLNIQNEKDAATAFRDLKKIMTENKISGSVLIQKMAAPGTEVIVGTRKDPNFGQALMFGFGGILVEVIGDVVFHLAPITQAEAKKMICSIKAYPLLNGVRGLPPADTDALAAALVAVSHLAAARQDIAELDINPLIVHEKGKGCSAVDARIVIE